ncbi:zinc finger protein ZPR1-like isoform X2 [Glandiceps talaboti]
MAEDSYGNQPLFRDLDAEDIENQEMMEIESLCVNCEEMGSTRLLLTRIPFYKDVVIMSFHCPHCHYSNNEIQPGGRIQDDGCQYSVKIKTTEDLNRKVVKSDYASVAIPEIDFEIPPNTQKGIMTTVEGVIDRVVTGLEQDQPVRQAMDPDTASKIDEFIEKLKKLKEVTSSFTIILDDPTGNSFIENPRAPQKDPALTVTKYTRTLQQDKQLGLVADGDAEDDIVAKTDDDGIARPRTLAQQDDSDNAAKNEIMVFQTNCSNCNSPCDTNMKVVPIPHFKEVIIMSTTCDKCGHNSSEVKSGSGIEDKGKKMILKMTDISDLNRDILKSETCEFEIPELELKMEMGTLGGKFTTLEGLLTDIKNQLKTAHPFLLGDSSEAKSRLEFDKVLNELDKVISGHHLVTVILNDPAGNSYLQGKQNETSAPLLYAN